MKIPVEWDEFVASEYCDSVRDGTHDSPKFVAEGHRLVTSKAVKDGRLVLENAGLISERDFHDINKRSKVDQWDVLFTMIGTLGEVYIEQSPEIDYAIKNIGLFKCGSELKGKWLYNWLRSPLVKSELLQLRRGASQQYLSLGTLRSLPVRFPQDPKMAHRIVQIVSAYDDLIENNRRRIALLEDAARQLHKEWFVRFRFPGHEHIKIVDGVPEGWKPIQLADCVDVAKDAADPKALDPDTPYIGLEHLPRRSITLGEWETAEKVESGKFRFLERDIIFGKIRPYFHKVGFALTDGITSSDAIVMRAKDKELWAAVLMEVSSDRFVALASQTVKEGSKMPRANWDVLKKHILAIPPEGLRETFSDQINSIASQTKALSLASSNAGKARDLLLPKLMSGTLTV